VLGANKTAVQMAAPVRKILDPPTYLYLFGTEQHVCDAEFQFKQKCANYGMLIDSLVVCAHPCHWSAVSATVKMKFV